MSEGAPPAAWLLPGRTLPVSAPTATELRFARIEAWLAELGFHPVPFRYGRRGDARRTSSGGWRNALLGLALTPRLGYLALRERPRVVVTNAPAQAPAFALVKLLLRDRVFAVADVVGLQSVEVEQVTHGRLRRALYTPILRALEALLFRCADVVLPVNDRHAGVIRRRFPGAEVSTLRDGADADLADTPEADLSELGLPAGAVTVGFVGSLAYDRLRPAFTAWERLAHGDLALVIVGDGPDQLPYAREAARRGWLWQSVFFLGARPQPEAAAVLAACDIAYSECWSELGFPSKLYEYMALGKPIVVEGKPQLAEVLEDGRDARFFDTPDELADALLGLAADPELRTRLGRAARETFLAGHTLEDRRRRFAGVLAPVAPAGRGPADPVREAGAAPPAPAPVERPPPAKVSVVMPVLDGGDALRRQLDAIGAQAYAGDWEVVVADNGSGDGSLELAESWAAGREGARVVRAAERRGAAYARNRGAAAASGDLIAFCDADDAVRQDWLAELAKAATRSDVVGGRRYVPAGADRLGASWIDPPTELALPTGHGFLRFASGGNLGIWRDVFDRLAGFDEELATGEDIDISWRAQLAGHRLAFAPHAAIEITQRGDLRSLARQQYAWGTCAGQLYRRFGPAGMPRSSPLHAALTWARVLLTLPVALVSARRRGRWLATAALRSGRLTSSLRRRVVFL